MSNYKFKVGDKVEYKILDTVHFSGTIVKIDKDPKNKPYVIETAEGNTRYAHTEYLALVKPSTPSK